MATLYVKKVWSYNPKKYKYISYQKALDLYDEYISHCLKSGYQSLQTRIKSFEDWLKTEI